MATQTEYVRLLVEKTGISAQSVRDFLGWQGDVIKLLLDAADDGERVPVFEGLRVYKHWKVATKARQGISPFNGEPIVFKAKPAHWQVKAAIGQALK